MQPFPGLAPYSQSILLTRSGTRIHLYRRGNPTSPPVLLIHGLGDEADTWRHVIGPLSEHYQVIAPDLPGFGRSEPLASYSAPQVSQVLIELLDTLQIERATLVGHSMGAVLAHSIALEHPGRVSRLVLVSGSLLMKVNKVNPGTLLFLVPGLGEWLYKRLRRNPDAAYATLRPYYAGLDSLPQAERDFLYQRVNERVWSEGQRGAFLGMLRSLGVWAARQQRDLPPRLARLSVPTQVIWGEADQINPPENARLLEAVQPQVQVELLPGAGHQVPQERPEAILRHLQVE